MGINILTVCYLIASVTFILGLKMLSSPATARRGNLIAAGGMVLAILGTIFLYENEGQRLHNHVWIFGGLLIGGVAGTLAARKVKMTAMPEMVSLFNGMGGACAALISLSEFGNLSETTTFASLMIILLGLIIGTVSFAGSVVAWGKLNGRVKDITFKGQHLFNLLLLIATLTLATWFLFDISVDNFFVFYIIAFLAMVYGVCFVLPIGGADMPVVISLLNSFTGVAAACGGFLYDNKAMLTGGILVGAAGTLLTIMICKAMNRSRKNVLIGSFGAPAAKPGATNKEQGQYKEISITDAAVVMSYASKVMIVP